MIITFIHFSSMCILYRLYVRALSLLSWGAKKKKKKRRTHIHSLYFPTVCVSNRKNGGQRDRKRTQCNNSFNGSKYFVNEPSTQMSERMNGCVMCACNEGQIHEPLALIYGIKNYICTLFFGRCFFSRSNITTKGASVSGAFVSLALLTYLQLVYTNYHTDATNSQMHVRAYIRRKIK